jgi:hypothetical protein
MFPPLKREKFRPRGQAAILSLPGIIQPGAVKYFGCKIHSVVGLSETILGFLLFTSLSLPFKQLAQSVREYRQEKGSQFLEGTQLQRYLNELFLSR